MLADGTYTLAHVEQFRRSGRFGLIGVIVTMALVAAAALTLGQGEADPTDAYVVIFGIIAAYLVLLFFFQLRDVSRAEGADARAFKIEPGAIENPATLDEPELWAALAIRPIDDAAIRARKQTWRTTRSSIHTGILVCLLIFLTAPPVYLFHTFITLVVGAPLIVGVALWSSIRLMFGGVDRAYENASRATAPLGLTMLEHPDVTIEPKGVAPYRMGPAMRGTLVLEGERHGRDVVVRMPAGGTRSQSEVRVAADSGEFGFKARDGRLKADKGASEAVAGVLKAIPNSSRWNGVRGGVRNGAIEVDRKGVKGGDWLLDLWLAERLADALPR